jgi:UDP-N-acetylmuramyl tripeptide synthase
MFGDFAHSLSNLEPVPPRFQDAHYELVDAANAVDDYIHNPPGGKHVTADYRVLLRALVDALNDYGAVVGISLPQ